MGFYIGIAVVLLVLGALVYVIARRGGGSGRRQRELSEGVGTGDSAYTRQRNETRHTEAKNVGWGGH